MQGKKKLKQACQMTWAQVTCIKTNFIWNSKKEKSLRISNILYLCLAIEENINKINKKLYKINNLLDKKWAIES